MKVRYKKITGSMIKSITFTTMRPALFIDGKHYGVADAIEIDGKRMAAGAVPWKLAKGEVDKNGLLDKWRELFEDTDHRKLPRKAKVKNSVSIHAVIAAKQAERLQEISDKQNISFSKLVANVLARFLARQK